MKKFVIYLLFLFLTAQKIHSQKEFYNWYFGDNAAISFLSGAPVPVSGCNLSALESVASISDKNGNLLLYTDGLTVYNKINQIMVNGTGLLGSYSSTMVQIVPQPENDSIYYIFNIGMPSAVTKGLRYSVVNMNKDNGKGEVVLKDVLLLPIAAEKIAFTKHSNGRDYWVVSHSYDDNNFVSYLLSPDGLNTIPVVSSIGMIHTGGLNSSGEYAATNAIGYLKISGSGEKLAVAIQSVLELFSFDNSTGRVTSLIATKSGVNGIYGLEFSENENFLYVGTIYGQSSLFQYNIQNGTLENYIRITNPASEKINTLQMGPDGKIYVAHLYSHYLGIIQNPDNLGLLCNYISDGVYIGVGLCNRGLPYYLPLPKIKADFELVNDCLGDPQNFKITTSLHPDSVLWDFGDPASGVLNNSSDTIGVHEYPFPGDFDVELTVFGLGSQSKIKKRINIQSFTSINLGKDTVLCEGEEITLDVTGYNGTYKWFDGSTIPVKTINQPGEYYVGVTNSCGTARDTISVNYSNIPTLLNISDTTVCQGDVIEFQAVEQNGIIYNWSTGQHTSRISFIPSENEIISLQVTNENECSEIYDFSLNTINCYKKIEIPNVFTPNQDNINDTWIITNIENYPKAEILIFTRWGMELFKSKGYETPWDGTYNGKLLPTGCYYYIIILNNGTPAYTGHVSIYR